MKFNLVKTQAKEVSLQTEDALTTDFQPLTIESLGVELRVAETEETNSFAICFLLKAFAVTEERIAVNCEYWAFFESNEPLTKEFIDGPFTKINAPAIAYPYLRSFITNILVNAGYSAMHLPTLNFQAMAKTE